MDTPCFEVKTRVTRKGCRAQARARLGRHRREIWVVTAVLGMGAALLWMIGSKMAPWMAAGLVVVGGYGLAVVPFTAARLYESRNAAVDSILLIFAGDGIRVQSKVEESLIRYSQILELMEESEYLMIRMKHHAPLVFERSEVDGGRADELMRHLEAQSGREFRTIRL